MITISHDEDSNGRILACPEKTEEGLCISPLGLSQQNTTDQVAYTTEIYFLSSGGWKVRIQDQVVGRLGFSRGLRKPSNSVSDLSFWTQIPDVSLSLSP